MAEFKKQTYSDQVQEYIRQRILDGKLNPGDKVTEVAIATELTISRAPVREALQTLVKEGLIQSSPQRGKYIAALTAKEIENSYFTGAVLEAAAVAHVLDSYTEEDFLRMEEILRRMYDVADKGEGMKEMAPLDNEFHGVLFSRVDNDLLVELCKRSCQGISKFLFYRDWLKLYSPQRFCERHRILLDALLTRDPVLVEKELREHYAESGRRMACHGVDVKQQDARD
ncbi:GntR family transcriptional regulator [Desulfocurvus sp. DL9XJH121]